MLMLMERGLEKCFGIRSSRLELNPTSVVGHLDVPHRDAIRSKPVHDFALGLVGWSKGTIDFCLGPMLAVVGRRGIGATGH